MKTGKFEVVKDTIGGLAGDRRIQVLLIAFAFGAFIEGAAGFGTPVAISAAMLIGLGFKPLAAAGLALIGNTAPVAYGALGTPIITLAKVTGLNELALSRDGGPPAPALLAHRPLLARRGRWPASAACSASGRPASSRASPSPSRSSSSRTSWARTSSTSSPPPPASSPPTCSSRSGSRRRSGASPASARRRAVAAVAGQRKSVGAAAAFRKHSFGEAFMGWMPWIVLSVFVFIWGQPAVKTWMNGIFNPTFEVPFLHNLVLKAPPVAARSHPEAAKFSLNLLSATGTGLLLAGLVAGLWLKLSPVTSLKTYLGTLKRVRYSLLTIAAMLALGFTTRYSGSDSTMGLAFASTGFLFPFFSPLLGWLGVALTGSDTSSNVLFGNLQVVSAQQIGMNPILAAASNSSGGVMGKMIDAQSIVVAVGRDGPGRPGGLDPPLRVLALARPRLPGRRGRLRAGVLAHLDGPALAGAARRPGRPRAGAARRRRLVQ